MELIEVTNVRTKHQFKKYLEYAVKVAPEVSESYVMPLNDNKADELGIRRFNTLHKSAIHYCRANNINLDNRLKQVKKGERR